MSGGPLAQLVEQRTFNPWVQGSSPWRPTKRAGQRRYSVDCSGMATRRIPTYVVLIGRRWARAFEDVGDLPGGQATAVEQRRPPSELQQRGSPPTG